MASRALAISRRAAPRFFPFFSPSRRLSVGSCFDATVADGEGATETGLYGFPLLKTAKGFRRFVDEAIERSGELVSYVSQLPPSMEVIRTMDEISNTVCFVIDSAELCRNTHPDREYVEEANKASMRIHEYLHFLNTNYSLYNAVIEAEVEGNLSTEEAQRAAQTLRIDFEKGGIHLCPEKLERVNQLNIEIALLGRQSSQYGVKELIDYRTIYPKNLAKSVLSEGGWSNLVCFGEDLQENLDVAFVFVGRKLLSSDISKTKYLDQALLDMLKLSFTSSNFSMAFPYVAVSDENDTLENSLISGFAENCGHGLKVNHIAYLDSCSVNGKNFKKLQGLHSVQDFVRSKMETRASGQMDLIVFCNGGSEELDSTQSEDMLDKVFFSKKLLRKWRGFI